MTRPSCELLSFRSGINAQIFSFIFSLTLCIYYTKNLYYFQTLKTKFYFVALKLYIGVSTSIISTVSSIALTISSALLYAAGASSIVD